MREKIDYDGYQHTVYAQGRAISALAMASWMEAFSQLAPAQRPLTVLDLGSGTGRFTPALADTFIGPVYGVDPSAKMRNVALIESHHPAVTYLDGAAEHIPLPIGSCDLILLFLVWHHINDRKAAAAEIRRVLRPGGRVLVRSAFSDRMPDIVWHRYFPRARDLEREVFPTLDNVQQTFSEVGLRCLALQQVHVRMWTSLAQYAERLRMRAISFFEYLTEEEIARGFARLDADIAAGIEREPLEEGADVLVFG